MSPSMTGPIPSPVTSGGGEDASPQTGEPLSLAHQCSVCSRRYERLDHLKRHELSHQNLRHHACPHCPRRFNRRDLLNRHLTTHDALDKDGSRSRRLERASHACEACIAAKTKCSNQRPCQRCQVRNTPCVDGAAKRRGGRSSLAPRALGQTSANQPSQCDQAGREGIEDEDFDFIQEASHPTEPEDNSQAATSEEACMVEPAMHPLLPPDVSEHTPSQHGLRINPLSDLFANPNMIGQVPVVEDQGYAIDGDFSGDFMSGMADFTFLGNIFSMHQDSDFKLDEAVQIAYSGPFPSSMPGLSRYPVDKEAPENATGGCTSSPHESVQSDSSRAKAMGFEAFKKSPWLWTPAHQDHAFSESKQLSVNEAQIMQSEELRQPGQKSFQAPTLRDPTSRDEMLSMVLKFLSSSLKIRSFPSFNLLNLLIQAFFVRQNDSCYPFIHVGTFNPDRCRVELLAGIVASGSTLFAIPNVWKMGLAMQDVVKLAASDAIDHDNRLIRQISLNQAYFLWVETGLWSGFRRKMEIGEAFANNVPTMLRRAGIFRESYYDISYIPNPDDYGEVLRHKWLKWSEHQSFKRLAIRVLINEMRSSIAFNRGPVWSGLEISFVVPVSRDLWDARTPEEWKEKYLQKSKRPITLTLLDAMQNASKMKDYKDLIDVELAALAVLHLLWARVWSYLDSRTFSLHGIPYSSQGSGPLWLEAHRQELLKLISRTILKVEYIGALSPEARLVGELLMMSLFISSEEVQRLAGRYGEDEVARAADNLQQWMREEDKNCALWHAGQVIKAARLFSPTRLNGFNAIAVYHACLTLWAFTVLKPRNAQVASEPRQETQVNNYTTATGVYGTVVTTHEDISMRSPSYISSPSFGEDMISHASDIFLDGDSNEAVQIFLRTGHGIPFMRVDNAPVELSDPKALSLLIVDVFRGNFPSRSHPLPPLLENLASLMGELSNIKLN